MTGFVGIIDPDADRRTRFLAAAADDLGPWPDLPRRTLASGQAGLAWACGPGATVDALADDRGIAAVFGRAVEGEDGRPVAAAHLRTAWDGPAGPAADRPAPRVPEPFDGYHAALRMDADGRVVAGADLLGLFPLYAADLEGAFLLGSSPEPFRRHPLFRPSLDPRGLVGLMLLNSPVGGRTLLAGVRRVGPACLLVRDRDGAVREVAQHAMPSPARFAGRPFEEHVDAAAAVVTDALRRQAPPGVPHGLFLSGGLDSRLLAALLVLQGTPVTALTLGREEDLEYACARRVTEALGLEHHVGDAAPEAYAGYFDVQVRHTHLVGGAGLLDRWDAPERARHLPSPVVLGQVFDSVVGPHLYTVRPPPGTDRLDWVLRLLLQGGLSPEELAPLLRPEVFGNVVAEVVRELRAEGESGAESEFSRVRAFYLRYRQRAVVGGTVWPQAFVSTPVVPVLDRRLLDVLLAMPETSIGARRIEIALLRRVRPDLARLPLDGNRWETPPLDPSLAARLGWGVLRWVRPLRLLRRAWLRRRGELRRFYRIEDLDAAPWRRIRRAAEPHRGRLEGLLRRAALDAILPPPDAPSGVGGKILPSAGRKFLLGLLCWPHPDDLRV